MVTQHKVRRAPKVRLSEDNSFVFQGVMTYRILYDYASGKDNRYTVLIQCSVDDPLVIGRELDLETVRGLLKDYEDTVKTLPGCYDAPGGWDGSRKTAKKCLEMVLAIRNKRFG